MSFSKSQLRLLCAELNPDAVRSRIAEGQILSYLEGWHVIAEANRIFGYDGWDRETISCTCVFTRQSGERYLAAYTAKVRITVRAGGQPIVREGSGVGEANAASPGQAHDTASKAAETDATKRALMTFGNAFGLSLYKGIVALPGASGRVLLGEQASATGAATATARRHETSNDSPTPTRSAPEPSAKSADAEAPAAPRDRPNHDRVVPQPGRSAVLAAPEQSGTSSEREHSSAAPSEKKTTLSTEPNQPEISSAARVDKSVLSIPEPRRLRDPEHLRFVATNPCLVCGRQPSHAHHLKFAQQTALSRKVSDEYTVPLCALHHRELHDHGAEVSWWQKKKINPVPIAQSLWVKSRAGLPSATKLDYNGRH